MNQAYASNSYVPREPISELKYLISEGWREPPPEIKHQISPQQTNDNHLSKKPKLTEEALLIRDAV